MNACLGQQLDRVEARLHDYLEAASARAGSSRDPALRTAIEASEKSFEAYRDAECGAVFDFWRDGTIRTSMELTCRINLTIERTHAVWQNWLRYPDSTPPILPEPPIVHCDRLRCTE